MKSRRTGPTVQRIAILGMVTLCVIHSGTISTRACETPVYRYAMYRWTPAAYEIYFFHNAPPSPADVKVQRAINTAIDHQPQRTNLTLTMVDLAQDKELRALPPDVKQAWTSQQDRPLPAYMVVSPKGREVFTGKLDGAEIRRLVDSPARQKLAALLQDGYAGVLVLLDGKDEKANKTAAGEVRNLIKSVAESKVSLYSGPEELLGKAPQTKTKTKEIPRIGMVQLARDDPQEQWLIRTLLSVESDLKDKEYIDQPMVFAVYGRARALEPYIGKGITADNLVECIQFITGACSCTVKEQNPGLDLLTRFDWDRASELVAEQFGAEEGNAGNLASLFPQIVSVSGARERSAPAQNAQAKEAASGPAASQAEESLTAVAKISRVNPTTTKVLTKSVVNSPSRSMLLTIVGGVILALAILSVTTFLLLMKPR